ncbi:MAG TPA: D-tyrosyl-tRNA(Tyr) deacylase [Candidatus Wirthbacteria bacterium]|nr:D-tyrosyl-tRNA(Tyr) deacylase [Candidatus Wirthbacteria bacterium]
MRAVVQRVQSASVRVDGQIVGQIGHGLLVLLGVKQADCEKDADWLANKLVNLRIFEDQEDKMNVSLLEIGGEALVVSQFTLYGDCLKGRRPSFIEAAPPELADALYQYYVEQIKKLGVKVETGVFQAKMDVSLINDGPVTVIIDSPQREVK